MRQNRHRMCRLQSFKNFAVMKHGYRLRTLLRRPSTTRFGHSVALTLRKSPNRLPFLFNAFSEAEFLQNNGKMDFVAFRSTHEVDAPSPFPIDGDKIRMSLMPSQLRLQALCSKRISNCPPENTSK